MAATKLSTDVIDLSTNTEGLVIPSGVTGPDTADTTIDCNYPTTATSLYQLNGDGGVSNNVPDKCGTYNGTSTNVTYATGKFGNAASFNGSSSFIDLNSKDMYSQQSQITLSAWAYFDNLNTNNYIFSGTTDFGFYDYGNGYIYFLPDSTVTNRGYYQVNGLYTANSWVHIVMVFDGTATGNSNRLKAYINGVKLVLPIYGTIPSTTQTATSNLLIGKSTTRNTYFDGLIDQARIFPSALTQEDVTKLYNESTVITTGGRPTSPTEGLIRDNTTTGALEFYDGSLWQQISGTLVPDPTLANQNFSTILWNGNATARSIDVGFGPGLVWIKNTNNSTNSTFANSLFDTSRSSGYRFVSNTTAAEQNYSTHFSGISSTGFNLPSSQVFNDSGGSGIYASWNWKAGGTPVQNNDGTINGANCLVSANVTTGFSMVKYIGNYTAGATVGHGLEGAPDLIIFKPLTPASGWKIYCSQFPSPNVQILELYDSGILQTYPGYFNSTLPTADVFSLGAYNDMNRNNTTAMAYCWRSISGYSKIGTYNGTSAASNFQETGFQPSWIMVKCTNVGSTNWVIVDNKRISGSSYYWTYANSQDAQEGPYNDLVFNSTGFTVNYGSKGSFVNQSGRNYIYMAFA